MSAEKSRTPVWAKKVLSSSAKDNAAFCAGRDVTVRPMVDVALIPHDIACSVAHNVMLYQQGILTKQEARKILKALAEIKRLWSAGKFKLDPLLEDVHMNIETFVSECCGIEAGGKMHTGRSRNDQVACDVRLYLREQVLKFHENCFRLAEALVHFAGLHLDDLMPGFTHRQHGAISTVAHWALAHAQGFSRDLERFEQLYHRVNQNPLGAAAGYGTAWKIDRELTTSLLGFDGMLENSLDAVSCRGETENEFACDVALMMNHLSRLAEDIIFFTTQESGFFRLADDFVTGSSIMPQKRNPDLCEVIQAKTAFAHGSVVSLLSLCKGILSGYDREMQWTKYTVVDLVDECLSAPDLMARALLSMHVDAARLQEAARVGFLEAVDLADWLASHRGLSFREGYRVAAQSVEACRSLGRLECSAVNACLPKGCAALSDSEFADVTDLRRCLARRDHVGAPSPKHAKRTALRITKILKRQAKWKSDTQGRLAHAQERLDRSVDAVLA